MAEKDKKPFFDKLNGKNYTNWSYRMKLFLQKEKCWDVINLEGRPANITQRKWNEMEQNANFHISVLVENNQLPFIKRTNSPREAWVELSKHHKKSSLTTKIRLLRKLYHQVLPKDGNMEDHLLKLMEYYDELCEIGHVVDDKQFVSIIMTSVGEEYDNLITALDCRNEEDLSLDFVKCKLLDEYERKTKDQFSENQGETAYKIFTKPYYCDFCKTKGHIKKNCSKFMEWLEKKKKNGANDCNPTPNCGESANIIQQVDSDDDGFDYLF